MADTRMMSIVDSIKCGLPTFSPTAKYNRGDRFVYEGNVCEVTDVMDGEAGKYRVFGKENECYVIDGEILEEMEKASRELDISVVNLDYNKSVLADNSIAWIEHPRIEYPKRLVCEYCGCISGKDHGTCEHCGAVLK